VYYVLQSINVYYVLQRASMCIMYYKTHQCALCITKSINVHFVFCMHYKTHQCVVCITKHINVYYVLQNTSMCIMYYKTHQCVLCITKHTNVYYVLQPHLWCNGNMHACLKCSQTKDYKIGICYFSAKHAALRSKSKDWLTRNQNNVSEGSDMSICGLLFQ
jgi:hypothetical protein